MKLLVAILLTVVTITRAYGAEPDIIGSVTELDGIGQIKRENETVGNSTGTTIQQMDEASTKKGKMRIDFVDETRLDVVDHSKIIIDEFVYDPATGKGSLDIRASLGAVRYASGQIAKTSRQKVRLRTPTALSLIHI